MCSSPVHAAPASLSQWWLAVASSVCCWLVPLALLRQRQCAHSISAPPTQQTCIRPYSLIYWARRVSRAGRTKRKLQKFSLFFLRSSSSSISTTRLRFVFPVSSHIKVWSLIKIGIKLYGEQIIECSSHSSSTLLACLLARPTGWLAVWRLVRGADNYILLAALYHYYYCWVSSSDWKQEAERDDSGGSIAF